MIVLWLLLLRPGPAYSRFSVVFLAVRYVVKGWFPLLYFYLEKSVFKSLAFLKWIRCLGYAYCGGVVVGDIC